MVLMIIGSAFRIEKITQTVKNHFQKIEIHSYLYKPDKINELKQVLQKSEFEYDAILFTGIVPYQAALSIHSPSKPWTYMRRDERQLMKALLKAQTEKANWDIYKLSLDSYEQRDIKFLYKSIGADIRQLQVKLWRGDIFNSNYISECVDFHRKNLKSGSSFAITGSYPVYQRLKKSEYPVILLEFDDVAVIQAVENLQLDHLIDKSSGTIQIDFRLFIQNESPVSIIGGTDRYASHQYLELLDKIYFFANKYDAAVYELGGRQLCLSTLLTVQKAEDYQRIVNELLVATQNRTSIIAIGVGLGKTSRHARACAELAYREAKKEGKHCAFIGHELNHVDGPIMPISDALSTVEVTYKDGMLSDLVCQTGISITFLRELKKLYLSTDYLTTKEIVEASGFTLRKVNRLLSKLEEHQGIRIVGSKLEGARGRPLRVIQVLY